MLAFRPPYMFVRFGMIGPECAACRMLLASNMLSSKRMLDVAVFDFFVIAHMLLCTPSSCRVRVFNAPDGPCSLVGVRPPLNGSVLMRICRLLHTTLLYALL